MFIQGHTGGENQALPADAALFGFMIMGDRLNAMGFAGCALIFVCIVAVQMMPVMASRRVALLK